jgi:hypothetical protein
MQSLGWPSDATVHFVLLWNMVEENRRRLLSLYLETFTKNSARCRYGAEEKPIKGFNGQTRRTEIRDHSG